MNKKYLVTGGDGFIGSCIMKKLAEHSCSAVSYDIRNGKDILDETTLAAEIANGYDGVFHCAALISVPESMQKPEEYYRTNVLGTQTLIKVLQSSNRKSKIVFSSSAAVYGEKSSAVSEEMPDGMVTPLSPKSNYAQNKIDGERIIAESGMPAIALRYFNVYGPGQSLAYAGVITFFIEAALKGNPIIIFGDGNQLRDFIFVSDIAEANVAAMFSDKSDFNIYNIASGTTTDLNNLAALIIRLTGSSSKIIHKPAREGDIMYSAANISKATMSLGWKPKITLETGLDLIIAYMKKNMIY